MAFPTALTNAVDGVTEIISSHLNNLEAKVGVDASAVASSLDYMLRHGSSIDPGHKHTPAYGGTGIYTYAVGDLLYASGATTLSKLADVAVGQVLVSGGVGAAPAWSGTPTLAGITCTAINPLTTAAESWVGPSTTTGIYFKGGNVGIGLITPATILDIKPAYGASYTGTFSGASVVAPTSAEVKIGTVLGSSASAGDYTGLRFIINGNGSGVASAAICAVREAAEGDGSTAITFCTRSGTLNLIEKVRISGLGYVGIGTLTPAKKFHIFGDGPVAGGILLEGGDGGTAMPITIHSDKDYSWAYHSIFSDVDGNLTIQAKWQTAIEHIILQPSAGNVGIGVTAFGTAAAKVLGMGSGTAPTTAPADMAQMWVADINGAAGYAGLHKRTETTNLAEVVPGVVIKTDTGSPANPYEGLMEINTFDNKVRMYADAGWRELATW